MSDFTRVVAPHDPAGTGDAYRRSRILVESQMGLHPVCWMFRASDGLLHLAFSHDFTVAGTGTAVVNEGGELIQVKLSASSDLPKDNAIKPHVSLHPSGYAICASIVTNQFSST